MRDRHDHLKLVHRTRFQRGSEVVDTEHMSTDAAAGLGRAVRPKADAGPRKSASVCGTAQGRTQRVGPLRKIVWLLGTLDILLVALVAYGLYRVFQ